MHRSLKNGMLSVAAIAAMLVAAGRSNACSVSGAVKVLLGMPAGLAPMLQESDRAAITSDFHRGPSIVGLWKVDLIAAGQVVDQGFDAYHSDRTEILIDTSAPATDNVCLGVWEQTGPLTVKLKHPSWYFDLNGNLLGIVIISETVKLDPNGESFSGVAKEDVYDLNGNLLERTEAQLKGTRIKPD